MATNQSPTEATYAIASLSGEREREIARALPQLRRFAARLLPSAIETETVIMEIREVWNRTEGSFDVPIRHLLRLVAQACIERQRQATRAASDSTDETQTGSSIANLVEVSLLIAVNRMPRRAREAFVASVLGRSVAPEPEAPAELAILGPKMRCCDRDPESLRPHCRNNCGKRNLKQAIPHA